jgi:hypothetical protein
MTIKNSREIAQKEQGTGEIEISRFFFEPFVLLSVKITQICEDFFATWGACFFPCVSASLRLTPTVMEKRRDAETQRFTNGVPGTPGGA